jgi:hypothetical protein
MKDLSLTNINTKLLEIADKYSTRYPEFVKVREEYNEIWGKLMMKALDSFTNQTIRDTVVSQQMKTSYLELYVRYNSLVVEIHILDKTEKILQQISRNLISQNFGNE